jgi:hypothetical protein
MTQIKDIIQDVLEDTGSLSFDDAEEVAALCERRLLATSLEQLATVIGGDLFYTSLGEAVIHTGLVDQTKSIISPMK